jgi:antitoxin YefM
VTANFAWYLNYWCVRSLSDSHPRPDTAPTRHQPQPIPCDQATDRQQRTSDGASQGSDVGPDRTPIEITSRRGDAVLLARADYDALEETAHLLRVPALATTKIQSNGHADMCGRAENGPVYLDAHCSQPRAHGPTGMRWVAPTRPRLSHLEPRQKMSLWTTLNL